MTKIKFCGLKTLDDISFANELRPEYVGFVFAPKSKRYVAPAQAKKLRAALDKNILAVGVFVNENISARNFTAPKTKLIFKICAPSRASL